MTNHDMLAFIYENGPCNHIDVELEFGCGQARIAFCATTLMISGFLEYDQDSMTFRYAGMD